MDRGRERRYEDDRDYRGGYRSSERDARPRSGYRGHRSPPPRERTPPSYRHSHSTRDERRRSRSPPYSSRGGGSYRGRARSPPPRGYSPQRDARPRSPPPRARRYSRSPIRARSPPPPRRELSPLDRRPRSPQYVKRPVSPQRNRYDDRRDFSPQRNPRSKYASDSSYRQNERERSPPPRRSEHISRVASPISSRRSSPPIHPDRLVSKGSHSPGYRPSRAVVAPSSREAGTRERSPPPPRRHSPTPASPPREPAPYRQRSPRRDQNDYRSANGSARPTPTYRSEESRAPPRGPSRNSYDQESPPITHPAPTPLSAHSRPSSNPLLSAPTRPRGGPPPGRPESRDQGYSGPPRGGRPPPSPFEGHHPRDSRPPSDYAPHGPRSGYGGPPHFDGPPRHGPPFRSNNSSSTTYPRTQRFNTANHLASLPSVIPGGKVLPSMDPAADKRASQLEEEATKLREQIAEKQKEKRAGLREWDSRERESRRDGLRSDLAEQQLQGLSGEMIGGQAF